HYLFLFHCLFFILFFFQAEDGIRDRNVTGVQTCAFRSAVRISSASRTLPSSRLARTMPCSSRSMRFGDTPSRTSTPASTSPRSRSEERRVGKGWRARPAARQQRQERTVQSRNTRTRQTS